MAFSDKHESVRVIGLVAMSCLLGPAALAQQSLPVNPNAFQAGQSSSEAALQKEMVPQDARELLLAAAQVNGLEAAGLKPWHILVSYDKFDEDGDNVDSGTYEEFWLSPKQYRLSFTSHDFTQTDFATETGLYRTGDLKWPGELQTRVRDEFLRPMFRELNLQFSRPEKKMRDFGKVQLPCVMLRSTSGNMVNSDSGLAAFCFEPNSLILRYSKGGMASGTIWDQIVYDKIVRFQGRYVASDVQVKRGGKQFLKLHLESLEPISQPNPADLIPPPTATVVDANPIPVDGRVLTLDYLIHQEFPQYPKSIRPPGGEAVMTYKINKEGRVEAMQFLEGNSQMQKGLEQALKKFVYRPFLVRGEPVDVEVKQKFVYEVH
jgi:hypothetical protein